MRKQEVGDLLTTAKLSTKDSASRRLSRAPLASRLYFMYIKMVPSPTFMRLKVS